MSPAKRPNRASATGAGSSSSRVPLFLGHSTATRAVYTQLRHVLRARPGPVLLIGAPGTGKRVIAEMISRHRHVDAELGEHRLDTSAKLEPSAPLGQPGSPSYLCPIEALDLRTQAGLLHRVSEGAALILATRLEPESEAWRRRLHPGLLDWCSQRVRLPSLSARIDDLDQLATRILLTSPLEHPIAGISDEALACLRSYDWPGNVTELETVLREAFAAARGFQVELWDLPARVRLRDAAAVERRENLNPLSLAAAERRAIVEALRQARGNKRKAARMLEVGKTTLYRKLASYEIS